MRDDQSSQKVTRLRLRASRHRLGPVVRTPVTASGVAKKRDIRVSPYIPVTASIMVMDSHDDSVRHG